MSTPAWRASAPALPHLSGIPRMCDEGPGTVAREGKQTQHPSLWQGATVWRSAARTLVSVSTRSRVFSSCVRKRWRPSTTRKSTSPSKSLPHLVSSLVSAGRLYNMDAHVAVAAPSQSQDRLSDARNRADTRALFGCRAGG